MGIISWLIRETLGISTKEPSPSPQQTTPITPTRAPAPQSAVLDRPAPTTPATPETSSVFSRRSIKQLGLFFGGATLLTLSVLVSRRAALRHSVASRLRFYQQNHSSNGASSGAPDKNQRDPLVAIEALNLATLNVAAFAVMATGGFAFAFDISSVEELRTKARRKLYEGSGDAEVGAAAEREIAEWMAKTLNMKLEIKGSGGDKDNSDNKPSR